MRITLLRFGKDHYTISENTLSLLENLTKESLVPIGLFRPIKHSRMPIREFQKEFMSVKPADQAGIVTEIDFNIEPGLITVTGELVPEGKHKNVLKAALATLGDELKLIPRLKTHFTEKGFNVVNIYGFDLFLEENQLPSLLIKHTKMQSKEIE